MSIINDAREIVALIKKSGDIELERKILNLQSEIIELTQERNELKEKCSDLQAQLTLTAKMTFKPPVYYAEGDPTPLCPTCWENDGKSIHLVGPIRDNNPRYYCNVCEKAIYLNE